MFSVLDLDIENSINALERRHVEVDDLPSSGSGGARLTPDFECAIGPLIMSSYNHFEYDDGVSCVVVLPLDLQR